MSISHKRTRCLNSFVNHITSAGTLNHNTRIQLKLEIWRNWTRSFSNDCPDKLQEFVWFNLCYYLGRREREGWRELTKNPLKFKHDDQHKEHITIKHTEQTKNNQGGCKQKDQDYTDVISCHYNSGNKTWTQGGNVLKLLQRVLFGCAAAYTVYIAVALQQGNFKA